MCDSPCSILFSGIFCFFHKSPVGYHYSSTFWGQNTTITIMHRCQWPQQPVGKLNTNTEVKIQETTRKLTCIFAITDSSTYPASLEGFSVTLAAPKWFPMFATSSCWSFFQPKKSICWYQIAVIFITYLELGYCNIYISVLLVKQLISLFCQAWLRILGAVKVSKLMSFSWL